MAEDNFIKDKMNLLRKDKQPEFDQFGEVLGQLAQAGESSRLVRIPADGNWFKVAFDAVEQKKDRLVVSARRVKDGLVGSKYDPSAKEYVVEFEGTRAAYLKGYHHDHHRRFGWPYISWDVRSYTTVPQFPDLRVYVESFRAHNEIKKLIQVMEAEFNTGNVYNSYINDNLKRFQSGIRGQKTVTQIESEWSRGMMEGLGFRHVEGFDSGYPQGNWAEVHVHWAKLEQDLKGGAR